METKKSFCRICPGDCAIEVDVEDGVAVAVRGDSSDPMTGGYTCLKGRQIPDQLNDPERLRTAQKRKSEGYFEPIPTSQAMDEIAEQLTRIIAKHGPRAVATYSGTFGYYNAGATEVARAWHQAIGSPSFYTSLTIDQPAKIFALSRIGMWGGGTHSFSTADVVMIIGNNPLVSHLGTPGAGLPGFNPVRALNDAKKRGLKIICVDPRRTELAKKADLHLQIRPGEDPTLLAGMLKIIFDEELYDAAFCAEYVEGLEALRDAVSGFSLEMVAARTGLPAKQVQDAARLFGRGPRGCVSSGTGPDMAPHPNLTEHLICALNIVCGRFNRVGERVENPGVLGPALPRLGQPIPPAFLPPMFKNGSEPSPRVRGLQQVCGEMPTPALAEEILLPGEGQVRALIVTGGNPVLAWPDQGKTIEALRSLDLLVCIDPKRTATARLAHYIIAPKLHLEREDLTHFVDMFYEGPYAHYTNAVVEPGPELIEDFEFYLGLAQRMGVDVSLPTGPIDLSRMPSKYELLSLLTAGSRIPLEQVRDQKGGHLFEEVDVRVDPPIAGLDARLQLAPSGIAEELAEVHAQGSREGGKERANDGYTHLLICRRMREVMNSVGQDFPESRAKRPTNPAYVNEGDLKALGAAAGDLIEIAGERDAILAVAEPTDELQPGVIALAHSWGDLPERDGEVRTLGTCVARLIPTDRHFDPLTGMARQTAIPVKLRRVN